MNTTLKNAIKVTIGEGFWGFQANMVAPSVVLSVLLGSLGASTAMIGSIASIEIGGMLLPQLLGMWIFRSNRNKQNRILVWHLFCILPGLLLMGGVVCCTSVLGQKAARWLLLLLFLVMQGSIGVVVSVWIDWLSQIFPRNIRGTVFGVSWGAGALLGTLGGLLSGRLISDGGSFFTYGMLYFSAGIIGMISLLFFWRVHYEEPPDTGLQNMNFAEMGGTLLESLKSRNFRAFLFGRALMMSAFCITPLIATFYMSMAGGGLKAGTVISCGAIMAMGLALGNAFLGRMGDVCGHRWSLVAGAGLQIVALGLMLCTSGLWSCLAVYFITGFATASNMASHSSMLIDTCPHDHVLSHLTIGGLLLAPGAILFPILAGNIASLFGLQLVFAVGISMAFLSIIWMVWCVKTPAQPEVLLAANTHG